MKKILYPVILQIFLFSLPSVAQETFIGKILEKETNIPVFGAAIIIEDNVISVSDENGIFKIRNKEYDGSSSFIITHMSYNTEEFQLAELMTDEEFTVFLEPKIEVLEAVTLNTIPNKEVLKNMFDQFKKTYKYEEYLAPVKYDQIIKNGSSVEALLQMDGYVYMPMNTQNPFIYPNLLPEQLRRTKENREVGKKWFVSAGKKEYPYNQLSGIFARTIWQNYGMFEVFNPLNRKEKRFYTYNLSGIRNLAGKKVYAIKFKQKKEMSKKGWSIHYVHGEILIDYSTFLVKSITYNFKVENLSFNSFIVDYELHNNRLFPAKIKLMNYRFSEKDEGIENIVIEGILEFGEFAKYKKDVKLDFQPHKLWIAQQAKYDPEYWEDRSFLNKDFKELVGNWVDERKLNNLFMEGYKQGDHYENGKFGNLDYSAFENSIKMFNDQILSND